MSITPEKLRYLNSHEWAYVADDSSGIATIGISAFAVEELTDLVFMALPKVGQTLTAGSEFGEVESVKAVSPMYSPVSGTVVEIHSALVDKLESLSVDPYNEGWIIKVKMSDPSELCRSTGLGSLQKAVQSLTMRACVPGLVILDPPQTGEVNMAVDEALQKNATSNWPIVMRVYQWDRPTLSLGHFQRLEDRDSNPLLAELPWVRRKTGGGAIVHDLELTYSIVIPNRIDQPTKGHSESLYRAIHLSLVENLRSLGWDAKLSESCTCKTNGSLVPEPFLCFLRRSPVDIVVNGDKIVGSAQRRSATGLLQHGSLLLRRSQSTPELCGLLDTTSGSVSGHQENLRRLNSFDASNTVDAWVDFLVQALKAGLEKILPVDWRNGTLGELGLG